ncbi:MAG TPA: hypothetical protein VN841_05610 [Bryobacteraceae bacterium]|nr:hypothetical protein [Bryobacteraceae bacterium]
MKLLALLMGGLCASACAFAGGVDEASPQTVSVQLLAVKRVYVDRLTGGETAAQMRDLLITALQGTKLFVVTENADRADAFLRGAAEDLVYTDTYSNSESTNIRGSSNDTTRSSDSARAGTNSNNAANSTARGLSLGVGENESNNIKERKHEALATVRLVGKDGDVLWSTTQESNGAKFRGASADVADRIAKQLAAEFDRQRRAK